MPKLTPKQNRFVLEYLANGMNATKAAISAGYSKRTAASIGEENLRKPEIAKRLSEKVGIVMAKLDFSVDRVMQEIARLAFFDVAKLFEDDGSLKRIKDIDEDTRSVIAGLEVTEIFDGAQGEQRHVIGLMKKVKLSDRRAALDMLMRYHALYQDKVEHTGKNGGPVEFVITRAYDPKRTKRDESNAD
jgi:phage terminase small subunit